ncbi:hypothetical protein Tsubulata_003361, partial [Turnera subulata]
MDNLTTIFTLAAFSLLLISIPFLYLLLKIYSGKSIRSPSYPPVNGTVFGQLFYFNRLYDQQTEQAKEHKTFRLLAPDHSEIFTTDPRNIEHALKTRFDKYSKGKYEQDILTDLFGEGIFAVDGDKWRQQRKLSSFEFSTRVLRDFSSAVFRTNAAKLVRVISDIAIAGQVFDMQDILMRCTLDSIFKVGFGVELNCLTGSSREGTEFMKAFDDSNALVYWRYVDPSWKLKRYFNVGSEASLRKNIKNEKEDILSRFLVESKKDPEKMNDRYLRDIILNFMIAGKDTSANTLSWSPSLCHCSVKSIELVYEAGGFTWPKGTEFGLFFHFNRLHGHLTEVARKHKTFRLLGTGRSLVLTTDIRNIEHVLKTSFDKYSKGKHNQDIVADVFGEGIFAVDGDKWRQQRKLSSFEFSTRVLRDFGCSVFKTNAAKLARIISGTAVAGQVFDMQDILMRCTLDSIFKVGFGVELNCLSGSSSEGTEFMKAFDDSNALLIWRYVDPFWKLKRYFNVGSEASLKKNIKVIDDFVAKIISTKRKLLAEQSCYNDKEDILSRFLVESKKDPEKMNDRYLRDIILNIMFAGKDTSANTISWFFYMLCKNPLIQEKVAQEVRDVIGSQEDEADIEDFTAKLTDSTLEQMHYLHAALSETLRLYPAVPVDGRCAEVDDILPDGYRLEKGDGILHYLAYAMGRMPYIWGEDAQDFRLERWLKNVIFQPESPFKFIAFHAGPRTCLGKDFAYRQMKIVSMALLRFLRFKLADGTKNWRSPSLCHSSLKVYRIECINWAWQDILMRCTLDSIFKVGFGVELNCLAGSSKEGTEFMKAFDDSNALVYWRYVDPSWKLKRYFNVGSEASLRKNIKNEKEDILSRFLVESKKDPEKMNDRYLRDIILNFMIAGKDTSANTLSWFFYMLCKNPLIQEKVAQEVRDVTGDVGDEVDIEDFIAKITDSTLDQMHYLHATLSETLRLYPAVPVDGRCAEVDDILPDGYRLKKGDGVNYLAYAMGRMSYIWGEDAEDFRPERWLKNGVFQPESPFKSPSLCHCSVKSIELVYEAGGFTWPKGTEFGLFFHFNRLHGHLTEVARKHKTFRLLGTGRSLVLTTDIRNIEHVLKTSFDKYSKGKHNQDIVADVFGEGQVFDMQDILMRCTLDSIFKVGFGVELNCLSGSSSEGTEFMKAFDDSNALLIWRYVDPFWKLKRYFNVGSEASLKKNIKVIDDFVAKIISTKRKLLAEQSCYNDKEDILSRFLVESKKDPEKMNDRYLRDIILNIMFAGKDTSANTLSWFFYMLCKNPLIQEKVAEEVRDVIGSQEDEADIEDFTAKLTDSTLEQMHYLHAALSETLRLYPAVPVDGRCAEVDDILPDGYRLKKGDGVGYLAYAMGRMPYIWGEDAEDFRPERWLKNGIFQPESPFKFIAFHAGPRTCLGKDFAYRQMKIVSMALLRFLQFRLAGDRKIVTYKIMFTLHISGGLHLCATARCTLDSIFKVGFGVELNCLAGSSKEGTEFMKAFDDSNALVYWRYVDPLWKLKRYFNIGSEASLKKNIKTIDDFVAKLITTKRKLLAEEACYNDKEDILSRFLVESKKDPENMNDRYLRDIILNFMIAGKDSSANTLSWLFYMLCKNPLIQEKVAQEVRDAIGSQEDEADIEDFIAKITDSTLDQMHYLHAALSETLRLYPAVPVDGRNAIVDDVLPDGYRLKKRDGVYYIAYAMGRMPYIWGEDAEDFRPERWLINGIFQPESPFKFIAFHAGPRICLGKDFAYRQMKIVAMALLKFFRFKLEDDAKNVTYKTMFTLHISGGLHLCATPSLLKIFYGKSIWNANYAPVYGTVFNMLFHFNRVYDYQTEVARKQKTFRLIAPEQSEIYTTDILNIEYVLKTRFDKYNKGKRNQGVMVDLLGEGIFAVDGDRWRQQRKLASFEFSTRVISDAAIAGQVFDMQDILMRCTLDSIFKVAFGIELNCLMGSSKEGVEFMKAFDDSNSLLIFRYMDPFWKLKRYFNIGYEASLKKNIKVIDDFVAKVISTKRKLLAEEGYHDEKEDILSRFLVESQKNPEKMNDRYLRDIILSFMFAGKDTSATTLSWFFYLLCKNPLIQEKIAQEVKDVTGSHDNEAKAEDFVAYITESVLERMHYLHATLSETLRLYPVVPVDGRCADEDDILPDGYRLKKGDGVYYLGYAMGRMPYIWGEDAEEFRPERWLKDGIYQPESPFKFIAFHAGPRICLGKDFAFRQMKIVAMALLRFFRFKLADDTTNMGFLFNPTTAMIITASVLFLSLLLILQAMARKWSKNHTKKKKYHPVAGTMLHQLRNFNRLHHYMTDLARKHKTYRLLSPFRSEVYTADPANGDYNYSNLSDLLGDGIFTVDGDKWRQQRKVSSYEFSTRVLRDYSSVVFRRNVVKLANIVSAAAKSNQSMDIQDLFMKSTLDSIFKVVFGVELDSMCGSNEEGAKFSTAFDDASAMILWRYVDVFWKVKKFLNIGSEATVRKQVKVVNDFVYKLIANKTQQMRNPKDDDSSVSYYTLKQFALLNFYRLHTYLLIWMMQVKKDDILSRFLQVTDSETNPKYLRDIILNFVIAGKDTTAAALSWFTYMLCKHQDVQEKVAKEIKEVTNLKQVSDFTEVAACISEEALEKMNYLHAAITETLRLYPSVPVDAKICLSDDTLPDGFSVRKGDMVSYQPYAMGRMKFVWGEDAEEYKPERWLNEDGIFQPESPFKFTAFQGLECALVGSLHIGR